MDLEATLRDLAPRVLRYCSGRAGDPVLGEEIAQEAMTALVKRVRRQGWPDSAEAFVFTIARRRLGRTLFRRRWTQPLETLLEQPGAGLDERPDPERTALAVDELAAVREGLDRLSGREREALLLVAAGELSTADAAKVLGISKSALKMRVHRARQNLTELLEKPTWNKKNAPTTTST